MKQYNQDNYIEWIGVIPSSWKISKIGELYTVKNIKVSDIDYPPLSVTKNGILPQLENAAKSDAHDDRKLVNKGDFVINSRSDRRGSCGISSLDGSVSLINTVLSPKIVLDSEYYNWLFHTAPFADEFYKWGHGIVDDLWTTNWQNMKNIKIPIPSLEEQNHISNFLNRKCIFIDSLINDEIIACEKLAEYKLSLITEVVTKGLNTNVPMKDSSIKWIGKIPEHWEVDKLKNISQIKPSNVDKKSKDYEPPVLLCNYTDVYNNEFITNNLEFMKATASYDQIAKLSLDVGDVIITKDSESPEDIAVPAIVTEELENVVCGYHLAVIKSDTKQILPKFLFRSLESDKINKQFELGANGITRFGLGTYPISNAYICKPPLKEQIEIIDYLDKRCNPIDSLISEKKQRIDKLEEYKNSLIFEYVTGKKEVPNEI